MAGIGGEQLVLQLVVGAFEWAAVGTGAVVAVVPVAVALQVAAVEEVRLVAEGAGHPLPAQMVAGRVAIQQVLQEPVGSGFPVDPSPVHDPGGHPHAGVVVQPAGCHQLITEAIHAGQPRAPCPHIGRQLPGIGPGVMARFERFLIVMDAIPQIEPHPLPEVPPAEFVDQLSALIAVADPCKN